MPDEKAKLCKSRSSDTRIAIHNPRIPTASSIDASRSAARAPTV